MSPGFAISQLAGVWVNGISIAFNVTPPGSGSGGSGAEGLGYTKTTTPRQRLLEERRKKYLAEMAMHMESEDELILILLGDI